MGVRVKVQSTLDKPFIQGEPMTDWMQRVRVEVQIISHR